MKNRQCLTLLLYELTNGRKRGTNTLLKVRASHTKKVRGSLLSIQNYSDFFLKRDNYLEFRGVNFLYHFDTAIRWFHA